MSVPRTVAQVIDQHVSLELESLDRVYLNVYQPLLQTPRRVFHFLREHHGQGAVSSHRMRDITQRFIRGIEQYARQHDVPVLQPLRLVPRRVQVLRPFQEQPANPLEHRLLHRICQLAV